MADHELSGKSVLVLGAYGFIGAAVTRALSAAGARVQGMGRNLEQGAKVLPVVWIQIRLRDDARMAAERGTQLPPEYHRLFRFWFACGVPAFLAVLTILWLMIARPAISVL
ncbi:DUF2269 family protein [Ruegeria sp. HKCCSP351]|uniref:DUF2269 family protein n=1 Tax=Ruegeria sp. HKCCSP351 TaxID=2794832 RepID=UPI001AE5E315